MDCGYRADILVEKRVIVDTKSIEGIGPLQAAQVLTYLRFLELRYGLILNFDVLLLKDGTRRVRNEYGYTSHSTANTKAASGSRDQLRRLIASLICCHTSL